MLRESHIKQDHFGRSRMKLTRFPYIKLPEEFLSLLKASISVSNSATPIFDIIGPNKGLYLVLEKTFKEFDDGRGLEKTMLGIGWPIFKERMASLYIYKAIYGEYPQKTQMDLVDDIKKLEARFQQHSIHGVSRIFLLGFYLKLANIEIQNREDNQFLMIKIPDDLEQILTLTQGKTERVDWLILITMHLYQSLGEKLVANSIANGKKFDELYQLMPTDKREEMLSNLTSYGASIKEQDIFLYEKI